MTEVKGSEQQERNLHIDSAKALKLYIIQIITLTIFILYSFKYLINISLSLLLFSYKLQCTKVKGYLQIYNLLYTKIV